ncbi:uncharacterized protein LOC134178085 [Corticium candelabrum]|uniref:uncharacterized protein LOC134178085 n=1 Tax=Corticium candelabrum TaxID=121492 RepID=UPI002E26FD1B|nr:uncharacterized protein LOC134178085 [Corticium candelabrum]
MDFYELLSSGEFSDLTVKIGDKQLHLHRFPLVARSHYFRGLQRSGMRDASVVTLDLLPGGYDAMKIIADFCYGVSIEDKLTIDNIGHVMVAAGYLQMTGSGNLMELCKSKLRELTTDATKCLQVLVNCADNRKLAAAAGVTKFCADAAVDDWYKKRGALSMQIETKASEWLLQLKKLSLSLVVYIIDSLQTKQCSRSLITYFAVGCIDFIMEYFQALRNSELQLSTDRNAYMEMVAIILESDGIEGSLPDQSYCVTNSSDRLALAARSVDEDSFCLMKPAATIHSSRCSSSMDDLLQYYFVTFLSYISERSLTSKPANMTSKWLSSVLRFSSARIPAAEDKLFVLFQE